MARRSSARLRNQSAASTPQRASLSHDAPIRTPRTVPAKLSALEEDDEMPGAFPKSASPTTATFSYPSLPKNLARPAARETPSKGTPIKPDAQEMHPQLYHQSTVKARDEARHLGFSIMAPHTEPPKQKSSIGALQGTPTRSRDLEKDAKSPSYQFTFRREFSLELSPEAKRLMSEKREEAARIRQQMVAEGDAPQTIDEILTARKLAKPKGRFSQAHLMEQQKMDSIANHASAWRAVKPVIESKQTEVKSLKRSPSKAKLDEPDTPSRPNSREGPKATPSFKGSALPRSTSFKDLKQAAAESSPAKRVKRVETDDVSVTRPTSSDGDKSTPATPNKQTRVVTLSTPTQASLARAASVKSTKAACKIPAPQFTPAKAPLKSAMKKTALFEEPKTSTPLLARSPAKASLFAPTTTVAAPVEKPASMMSASFARTPAKAELFKKHVEGDQDNAAAPKEKPVPFLSRSPVKAAVVKTNEEDPFQTAAAPAVPFLSRSPTKLPMASASNAEDTPGKDTTSKLMGRFNLLRQSPMKSILRSPQRLYSDDPSKVAAGTHLATPPGKKAAVLNKALPVAPPSTTQARKHVDFSSSTKARDTKMSDAASSSDSKTPTPSPKSDRTSDVVAGPIPQAQSETAYPQLPLAVPTYDRVPSLSPSPQKRRQTAGPQDFTFRAGDHDIVFAQSPNAPASAARHARPATIRYVSADAATSVASPMSTKKRKFDFENRKATSATDEIVSPPIGTKKRKFDFENRVTVAKAATDVEMVSDKENTPVIEDDDEAEQRPAKRSKLSAPSPKPVKSSTTTSTVPRAATQMTAAAAARRTTLGVKPKGAKSAVSPVKKPAPRPSTATTISQARLAALSQPKKRN
ncbi:hypothetical protein Slin15195_G020150 [Septoria linicola]|uniref:Erythromycin esterase n=1 Tax=Septoria linicola TaxID=215465 RepID=A0A9Q9AMJ9_9PEZI|nr:hypothetical protein Slin15195_G020150 [Septoria linicola]